MGGNLFMKNKYGNICCEGCGSYSIVSRVVFDGADWCSEAGEGSGFGWLVELIPEWSEKNLPLTPDKITFG